MDLTVAMDLAFGLLFGIAGGFLAFNVAGARDRYTAFLNRPDIPHAWRRSRINEPRFAGAYGLMFLGGGIALCVAAIYAAFRS
jgi:hypothetical protein